VSAFVQIARPPGVHEPRTRINAFSEIDVSRASVLKRGPRTARLARIGPVASLARKTIGQRAGQQGRGFRRARPLLEPHRIFGVFGYGRRPATGPDASPSDFRRTVLTTRLHWFLHDDGQQRNSFS